MAIRMRRREFIVTLGGARQRDELFAGSQKEQISTDNEPSGAQLREVREGCFEITFGACGNDRDPRLAPARHRDQAAKAPHDRVRPPLRPAAERMDDVISTRPATLPCTRCSIPGGGFCRRLRAGLVREPHNHLV